MPEWQFGYSPMIEDEQARRMEYQVRQDAMRARLRFKSASVKP